jgi:hypothetical protein
VLGRVGCLTPIFIGVTVGCWLAESSVALGSLLIATFFSPRNDRVVGLLGLEFCGCLLFCLLLRDFDFFV